MEHKIIRAIIPSTERPPRYLTTEAGEAPSMRHISNEDERRTTEGTLLLLGRHIASVALCVDYHLEARTYLTKPISAAEPEDGYTWSNKRPL